MEFDPRYVAARRILLDALFALAPHGRAVILCGAQAVYLRSGNSDLAIAPFTIDGDLVINPSLLSEFPQLEEAMKSANFSLKLGDRHQPGIWEAPADIDGQRVMVPVDLIVPDGFAPRGGRRGVRLGGHGNSAARKAAGLEAALIDRSPMIIAALDSLDMRSIEVDVAGVAALLIAKAHKIHDRVAVNKINRLNDKDAADVLRLMQVTIPSEMATTFAMLIENEIAGEPTRNAIQYLDELFGRRGGSGVLMAQRALFPAMQADTVEVICVTYIERLRNNFQFLLQ